MALRRREAQANFGYARLKIAWGPVALIMFGAQVFPAPLPSSLRVHVKSATGTPSPGVRVTISRDGRKQEHSAVTDGTGICLFPELEPGTYDLTVDVGAQAKMSHSKVLLEKGQHLQVELELPFPGSPQSGLGDIEFYDRPQFKPDRVNQTTEAGGYSASAYTDGYDLALNYIASEGARSPGAQAQVLDRNFDEFEPSRFGRKVTGNRLHKTPALPPNLTEDQFLSHGSELLLQKQFADAAGIFKAGIARFPESAKLQSGLGVADYACGRYDEAVRNLLRATDLAPLDPRPYRLLAMAYNASKLQSEEVSKRLERWTRLEPANALAYYYQALALWKGMPVEHSDTSRVEGLLKRAAELDPRLADAPLQLGNLYAEQGRYGEAIREYQQAIKLQPDLAVAHYRLAQVYRRTGDKSAALRELDAYSRLRGHQ
jgi:tetratricopeptide (TPR) repeat protein